MDMAREFYSNLPPPSECFAILVGTAELTIFGLAGLANPVEWSKGYGIPILPESNETTTEDDKKSDANKKTQRALVSAISARNITSGVLILGLACYVRNRQALGVVISANAIATLADALIVRACGKEDKVFGHAIGVFNSLAIGGSLLYWGRNDPWW